jgi:hypothetical protein
MGRNVKIFLIPAVTFVAAVSLTQLAGLLMWRHLAFSTAGWSIAVGFAVFTGGIAVKILTDAPASPPAPSAAPASQPLTPLVPPVGPGDTYHVTASENGTAIGRNTGDINVNPRRKRD